MATKTTKNDMATEPMQRQAPGQEGLTTQSADMNRRTALQTLAAFITGAVTGNSASSPKANAGTIAITNAAQELELTVSQVNVGKFVVRDGGYDPVAARSAQVGRMKPHPGSLVQIVSCAIADALAQNPSLTDKDVVLSIAGDPQGKEYTIAPGVLPNFNADKPVPGKEIHDVIRDNKELFHFNQRFYHAAREIGVAPTFDVRRQNDGTILFRSITPAIKIRFVGPGSN